MGSLTNDLLSIVDDLSLPVQVAWGVWFVWAALQTGWYWRSRPQDPVYRRVPRPRPSGLRIAAARSASSASRPVARASSSDDTAPAADSHIGGTPEFLAALGLRKRAPVATNDDETSSVYR